MDAIVPQEERRLLPALAKAIGEWFPELNGRSLAVSDCTVTKENVPTLPLCMVAFTRGDRVEAKATTRMQVSMFEIVDQFVVEFWLQPARYKKANGSETPFWSYYDYEAVRDTLLTNITRWQPPNGEIITFRDLQIGADPLAVTLTFAFVAIFRWCPAAITDVGVPIEKIGFNLCVPEGCCPETCYEEDPCDP